MTGGVERGDWWVERMDDDCECTEGEGVMIGDGSGGAEGEEACGSDVGEGEVGGGGVEREVGKGEKSENEKVACFTNKLISSLTDTKCFALHALIDLWHFATCLRQ